MCLNVFGVDEQILQALETFMARDFAPGYLAHGINKGVCCHATSKECITAQLL